MRIALLLSCGLFSASLAAQPRPAGTDLPRVLEPQSAEEAERFSPLWRALLARDTQALLIMRHDQVVFERYVAGFTAHTPHGTASLAKALVGGLSLMCAMDEGRIRPDDRASQFVPGWSQDPRKARITVAMLATHTSGIDDAEADQLPHDRLTGWKGDFWKRLPPPRDSFSLARDEAPVLDPPGTRARYSNPGMAMLAYCITAGLRGSATPDLRSFLQSRIYEPLGIPAKEMSVGYGVNVPLDGMQLVATWGGGAVSAEAAARIGELLLHRGRWRGQQVIFDSVVEVATRHAGLPNYSGLGWWVNRESNGRPHWATLPADAFWGSGAGHQFLLVVPSRQMVVVRLGGGLDSKLSFDEALEKHLVNPLMTAVVANGSAVHVPSSFQISWAPKESIIRKAQDSDNWPLTWGDDDALYTAYGDGEGFEPKLPEKLSLGFAKILGSPPEFSGVNVRSATGEQKGDGRRGRKGSGLLMVDNVLYLWTRNSTNSQLAWSGDHGRSWTWSDWRFTTSFGCPSFLNFGPNYLGARDDFVYIYSQDSNDAYSAADQFVLARVPRHQLRNRDSYQFFVTLDANGQPVWTTDVERRGGVFAQRGRCYRSSVTFNSGLRRYLWCQTSPGADPRFQGGFAIYDAPEPWGPWTEVFRTDQWDVGPGETCSFPTKWMSADGKALWLVFSGEDSFSVRQATLRSLP